MVLLSATYLKRMAESAPQPPPKPLDFNTIKERYEKAYSGKSFDDVEALLGPPDSIQTREPEFQIWENIVADRPDRYPSGENYWLKWTDPTDRNKWIAVFFRGHTSIRAIKKSF
jgi:hypothetical protein